MRKKTTQGKALRRESKLDYKWSVRNRLRKNRKKGIKQNQWNWGEEQMKKDAEEEENRSEKPTGKGYISSDFSLNPIMCPV